MAAFPEIVDVTDQLIDVSGFSSDWKEKVADLGDLIASKYRESGKERYLVAFGGASGTSKSTTAKVFFKDKQTKAVFSSGESAMPHGLE